MPEGSVTLNGAKVRYVCGDLGPAEQERLTTGSLAGLNALVKSYTLTSMAVSDVDQASMQISQTFETALVPIFQFAVFYENDLWTTPLFDMTINGRVHVNGNMYLQASTKLSFTDRVTASGQIHHGLRDGQHFSAIGEVFFHDPSGAEVAMKQGSDWIDAKDSYWHDSASSLWKGMVLDEAFGQSELGLAMAGGAPHRMIERGAGNSDSYEHKASFKIIDGVPYSLQSGSWTNVTISLPAGTVSEVKFYDGRENTEVVATEINMDKLRTSGFFPANGVIYSSDQRAGTYNGLRLTEGEEIGRPLAVFSENPVYIQGDFNTTNKQPVAVAGDVITYLSNNWNDPSSYGNVSDRKAAATTVNLSMITGDAEPTSTNYGGGLENLPRFIEDWRGNEFKVLGSMINLWRTKQAQGDWSYGSYYTAPTRDWSFDDDLSDPTKLPPETPSIRIFQRKGWVQEDIAFQLNSDTLPLEPSLLQ